MLRGVFILSIREAFVSLIPYFLFRATCILVQAFYQYFEFVAVYFLNDLIKVGHSLFPLFLTISLASHFSKNLGVDRVQTVVLTMLCFGAVSGYFGVIDGSVNLISSGSYIYSIAVPIFCAYLFFYLGEYAKILRSNKSSLSIDVRDAIFNIWLYVLVLIIGYVVFTLPPDLSFISTEVASWSVEAQGLMQTIGSQLLWSLGIHGTTSYRYLMDAGFMQEMIFPNLSYAEFFAIYVSYGGAGATLSLVIGILLFSKDLHSRVISKVSIPFTIFNINEIIVFGLPIVLSRHYILPFILVPCVNFLVAYAFLSTGLIAFNEMTVPWMMPAFLSSYIVTDGSLMGLSLQLFCLALGTVIYLPFINLATKRSSGEFMVEQLKEKLNIRSNAESQSSYSSFYRNIRFIQRQQNAREQVDKILASEMSMHYQPQVSSTTGEVVGFEALLRFKLGDGAMVSPAIINQISDSGFSKYIDLWVIQHVARDLTLWQSQHPNNFKFSLNLSPDSLCNTEIIDEAILHLSGFNLSIEVVENDYIKNFEQINSNFHKLKNAGIESSIDDFGVGYSSISLLTKVLTQTIKIDRSLLVNADSPEGLILYQSVCSMCKKLGFFVIVEGIEEEAQRYLSPHVDYFQGWLFYHALPLEEAMSLSTDKPLLGV